MILETERLILRRYTAGDLEDLYEYLSDDEVVRYEPYKAMTMKETEENLNWRIETDDSYDSMPNSRHFPQGQRG